MPVSSKPSSRKRPVILPRQLFGRLPTFAKTLFILGLVAGAVLSAWQFDQIRDFLINASGQEASLVIKTDTVVSNMPRPWRNLAQGGESHNWRLQPLTAQVAALKPNYIRIDHIYDFYEIVSGSPGNLQFNFDKLNLVLDDIAATGAKPYVVLSYMPPAISSGDIVAAPSDYKAWQQVVQRTVEHISGTRGIENVYYEVWNEPDLFGDWKYYGKKNYLDLYTYASLGAQNAQGVKPFKIGGPGITALYKNWFDALLKHADENDLRLDFFSWHRYNTDIDRFRRDVNEVRTWLQKYPYFRHTLELNITEWGFDSENHAGYDGSLGAAHTVATSIEMSGLVNRAFTFEIQDGKDPNGQEFWGRWGMFTHGDFGAKAKPRYLGLQMLDRISRQRLMLEGKGTWVKAIAAKSDNGNVEVVVANYDRRGRHSEKVPVLFTELEPGAYQLNVEYLDGRRLVENLATAPDSDQLQAFVSMPINSVAFVELVKK